MNRETKVCLGKLAKDTHLESRIGDGKNSFDSPPTYLRTNHGGA